MIEFELHFQGNLIKILEHFGLKCIGIEANPIFCQAAEQSNRNLSNYLNMINN